MKRLGDILIDSGFLTAAELAEAFKPVPILLQPHSYEWEQDVYHCEA